MQPDWEIWLDSNLSPIIAKWMADYTGYIVKSGYSLNFQRASDLEIYERAKQIGHIILISKDADFPELVTRLGNPPKLIKINIGNCDNKTMWHYLQPHIKNCIKQLITTNIAIIELA